MKKPLILTLLALSLVACQGEDLADPRVEDALNQEEIVENTDKKEEEIQTDYENNRQSEEEDEIKRTYPKEETKKEVIKVESSDKKEESERDSKEDSEKSSKKDKKDKKYKGEKSSDKKSKKDKNDKKADKNSEEKTADTKDQKEELTEDDYFFSYYYLVTVRDGEVVNALTDLGNYDDNYYVDYVPYSNNIFVLGSYDDHDFSIRKINGEDLTLLYDFKDNEDFRPKGMIGDKIYGIYHDDSEATVGDDRNQSGLAFIDLETGKVNIFEDTKYKNEIVDQVALTDKEILFTKFNGKQSTDLYRLDLEKGLVQKAELVEKDTDLNFLFSAKHFKKGKAEYDIFKSSDGKIKINDIEYNINDGTRFVGENIINCSRVKFDDADYLFKIDIINYLTGKTIEKDLETYGYRVYNGKLYYIDYDKKIKSLDIDL